MSEIPSPDRRDFLAASAAMLVAGPAAFAAAARRSMEHGPGDSGDLAFGMVTYLWGRDLSLPELLTACRDAGLDGVELRTTHAHGVERTLGDDARREIRRRLADSPVRIVGLGSDERFDSPKLTQISLHSLRDSSDL